MTAWIDKVGLPEVLGFAREQLARYDLSLLEWFKLLPLPKERYHGECAYPERSAPRSRRFARGYRIRCSVRPDARFPFLDERATATVTRRDGSWDYRFTRVEYLDLAELAVFVAGHEAFHFLRHSRQVPGRNTEPQANLHGLRWLQGWKCRD